MDAVHGFSASFLAREFHFSALWFFRKALAFSLSFFFFFFLYSHSQITFVHILGVELPAGRFGDVYIYIFAIGLRH